MSRIARGCILGFLYITLVLSFNTAYGKDLYQFEASTQYLNREMDNFEMRDYGLLATTYFKKVNVGKHPLAEAAFLNRISSIAVPAGFTQLEFNIGNEIQGDGPIYGAEITYAETGRPLYANASFSVMDIDFDAPTNGELSHDGYSLGIGIFLRESLLLAFEYGHEETEILNFSENENQTYTVSTKWVNEIVNGRAVNIEANLGLDQYNEGSEDGSNTIIGAAGDYYFNPRISIGAGLTFNTGDDADSEGNTFEIRSGIFFNPRFSINTAYEKFLADNDNSEDEQIINISLLTRF